MALKTLPELQNEIDQAVHTNGPQGKTRAAGLNTVLKSLATELTTQQQETAQALADQGDLLEKDNTWTGINYFSKGLRFYGGNGFDEYGQLYLNQLVIGNKYSWRNQSFTLAKDSALMWKPTEYTQEQGDPDVGLARAAAGVLEVTTGIPGNPATLTVLDVMAKAAPPALNSVTKLADALSHKADLDAGGRVPSSQLPSYVDDIVEATSLATLPAPGEAGKVYVTLDTNKQYRWAGTAYALLSDSGLTAPVKAGLEAAAAPSSSNPFATLADIPSGSEVKATRVVAATRERIFYSGRGTAQNPAADGLHKALAEAQPGDLVQQVTTASPTGTPINLNGEQIRLQRGVSYDTNGFDISALGGVDAITFVGGKGVLHGRNATIYNSARGSWALGWYGGDFLDYRLYDLHIHSSQAPAGQYANAACFNDARIFHSGNVYNDTAIGFILANPSNVATNQYEHEGLLTAAGACLLILIRINARLIQRGDIIILAQARAGAISDNSRVELVGGVFDLRNAQPNAGFQLDATSTLVLTDVTVLGDQLPALPQATGQAAGATVHLYGDTVLPDLPWSTGITVVDHRPVGAATAGTYATLSDLATKVSAVTTYYTGPATGTIEFTADQSLGYAHNYVLADNVAISLLAPTSVSVGKLLYIRNDPSSPAGTTITVTGNLLGTSTTGALAILHPGDVAQLTVVQHADGSNPTYLVVGISRVKALVLDTRDPYAIQDNAAVVHAVVTGTYVDGELQAPTNDPAFDGVMAGDQITGIAYCYHYCRTANGPLNWIRLAKA